MANDNIGKIEKLPLRDLWKNEARDFTTWLTDNIEYLNEHLNIDLTVVGNEQGVGPFSVDILAEDNDSRLVVIENQLEKTDHDHLGKLLTYLVNLNAKTAIWISSNPVDEHIQVIDWLNETTPNDISFFLIQIEAVRIGESAPAPLFTTVAEPSAEKKQIGGAKKELAERHYLRKDFWTLVLDKMNKKSRLFSNVSPSLYSWVGAGVGRTGLSLNIVVTNTNSGVELYLDKGADSEETNKKRFDIFYKHKEAIEEKFGGGLSWEPLEGKRACRIKSKVEGGLKNKDNWEKIADELIDKAIKFESAIRPFIREIQ